MDCRNPRPFRTSGLWLSRPGAPSPAVPCAAWLSEPEAPHTGRPVLVLPPIGYVSSSSYRFWRLLAESLAGNGSPALRLDYPATGDSAGDPAELESMQPWRQSVVTAAEFLRSRAGGGIVLVGGQLGATLALMDGPELGAAAVVAVAPVRSGRRFVRGLSVLGIRVPEGVPGAGGVSVAGHLFSAGVLADLAELNAPAGGEAGPPVLEIAADRVAAIFERPAEEAEAPLGVVEEIVAWISRLAPAPSGAVPAAAGPGGTEPGAAASRGAGGQAVLARDTLSLVEPVPVAGGTRSTAVREQLITVGTAALVGVLTVPAADADHRSSLYLLVNSGSDPHTGPGRAWVELARFLAARGIPTLRADLRSWGESPDGPSTPGRPYDLHGIDDIAGAVQALRQQGYRRIVLGGLCAGAWISLAAALHPQVAGSVAGSVVLNPQLYWHPGDPVEALMSTTRARRQAEIAEIKAAASHGRWDAEDDAGVRPLAGELLDRLAGSGQTSSLLFAEGDDGIEYLRDRLARRVAAVTGTGRVRVVELPGVDHAMHRTWLRPTVFEVVARELGAVLEASGSGRPTAPAGSN